MLVCIPSGMLKYCFKVQTKQYKDTHNANSVVYFGGITATKFQASISHGKRHCERKSTTKCGYGYTQLEHSAKRNKNDKKV